MKIVLATANTDLQLSLGLSLSAEPGITIAGTASEVDSLREPLQWRDRTMAEAPGKVVRLQLEFRHARIHALHGDFHFADALDVALTEDGKPIDAEFMDC